MSIPQEKPEASSHSECELLKIEECRTQYDLFRYLKKSTRYFGYEYFNLIDITSVKGQTLEQSMRLTNWPRELIHEYDANRLLEGSPVIEWCMSHATPMVYDMDVWQTPDRGKKTRRAHELFSEFDMKRGVYQPVHAPGFGSMALGMQGGRAGPSEDELRKFSWIAQLVCARTAEIGYTNAPSPIVLTDRERECLNWTAAGKTSSEIGAIVGISTHTVDHHLNSASQKLNASNRAHAVATAIRMKMIN